MAIAPYYGYDVAKGMLHFFRYVWIEFSGEPQVLGCVAERMVTQIRFENRQVGSQILSFQHPAPQAMYGEDMTVM